MLSLRKINPMARAVGTMGIVATMVGAVTFANLTSNTVALSPNTLDVATASLRIGNAPGGVCDTGSLSHLAVPGFNVTNFSTSNPATVNFCLNNDGSVPLVIGATVAEDAVGTLDSNAAAQATTLTITCTGDQPVSGTLATNWATTFPTHLASGDIRTCTATATLGSGYSGQGGAAIPGFSVKFVGTEPNS